MNSLHANPDKTQATAFHLRNREANRSLKVVWNGTELESTTHPKYLGVTLDRTITYKRHIQNTKMKVISCNNLLTKLATSKWRTDPRTIRMNSLALSSSTSEYTAPVWSMWSFLFDQTPANKLLKSRQCLLSSVQPTIFSAKVIRCSEWRKRLHKRRHLDIVNLHEEIAKGYDSPWTTWRCLNCLLTVYTCSKAQKKKWKNYTVHVSVEKKKKPRVTWCNVQDWHIPALWMTSSSSLTERKKAWTCINTWFDDTMMLMIKSCY